MADHKEHRPRVQTEGDVVKGWRATSHDTGPDALAAALDRGDHALLVTRRISNGGIRRRVMLSLGSAERAVRLAERAGQPATITLIRLQPVGHVSLEAEGGAE